MNQTEPKALTPLETAHLTQQEIDRLSPDERSELALRLISARVTPWLDRATRHQR